MIIKTLSFILMAAFTAVPFTSPLCAKAAEFPTDTMQKVKPATIKVLLQDDQDKFLLEVTGSYKVFCPLTNGIISSNSGAKRSLYPCRATTYAGGCSANN